MRLHLSVVLALVFLLAGCGGSDGASGEPPAGDGEPIPVDTTPPTTRLTAAPDELSAHTDVTFAFEADEPAWFECALDGEDFADCTSPHTIAGIAEGPHVFRVRAIDEAGNVEAPGVARSFAIDRTAPVTTFEEAPTQLSNATRVRFSFAADEEARFECAFDEAEFAACSSPFEIDAIAEGAHTFRVRAIDRAGNVESPEPTHSFVIDRTAPASTLETGPAALSNAAEARFVFSADEEATFECALDGAEFQPCNSPHEIRAIPEGNHVFRVRAVDGAGNVEDPASTWEFTLDRTRPVTSLEETPPERTTSTRAQFVFSANEEARFECALDDGAFAACSSPHVLTGLSTGEHVFFVRAIDRAGNAELSAATYLWTVEAGSERIRIVAANLTSGNRQSYDPGHGARILQGIDPDVVLIQEFNYGNNSDASIRAWVDETFGPEFHYVRESGAQIPNGVISRFPVLASGKWTDSEVSNRSFVWARLDVPGDSELFVVSVHLLTRSASVRNSEARQLRDRIQANAPAGDYIVIGGDFNTDSRSEACFSTFSSVVSTSGPYPVDQNGNGNTNKNRSKPYDHVLVSADLRAFEVPVVIGSSVFPNGLVVDTRVYDPIEEIAPARSSDSNEQYMQHMAVVRDFQL